MYTLRSAAGPVHDQIRAGTCVSTPGLPYVRVVTLWVAASSQTPPQLLAIPFAGGAYRSARTIGSLSACLRISCIAGTHQAGPAVNGGGKGYGGLAPLARHSQTPPYAFLPCPLSLRCLGSPAPLPEANLYPAHQGCARFKAAPLRAVSKVWQVQPPGVSPAPKAFHHSELRGRGKAHGRRCGPAVKPGPYSHN